MCKMPRSGTDCRNDRICSLASLGLSRTATMSCAGDHVCLSTGQKHHPDNQTVVDCAARNEPIENTDIRSSVLPNSRGQKIFLSFPQCLRALCYESPISSSKSCSVGSTIDHA
ncbi:hypothetical protein V1507DRAFT_467794 [Lipomyces tetrasporus]